MAKWKSVPLDISLMPSNTDGFANIPQIEELTENSVEEPTFEELFKQYNVAFDMEEVIDSLDAHEAAAQPEKNDGEKDYTEKRTIRADPNLPAVDAADCGSWGCFNLDTEILLPKIMALNYDEPTAVQKDVLPVAANSKKDIICAAPTGSGKTLAFGIPIVNKAVLSKKGDGVIRNLILVPTRELASQIVAEITKIIPVSGFTIISLFGGLAIQKQERLLKRKPCVVVATPGRFAQFIRDYPNLIPLKDIETLVIDECDQMLAPGNFKDLSAIFAAFRIADTINAGKGKIRQTMMFSATLSLPEELRSGLSLQSRRKQSKIREDVKEVTGEASIDRLILSVPMQEAPPKLIDLSVKSVVNEDIKILYCPCSLPEKTNYLYCALQEATLKTDKVIVFVNSISSVKKIGTILTDLGLPVGTLHASKLQQQRLKTIEKLRSNSRFILVATDVAARGLDIPNVDFVVHYHKPHSADDFVHRSGRAGRAGREGTTLILEDPEEIFVYQNVVIPMIGTDRVKAWKPDPTVLAPSRERVRLASRLADAKQKQTKEKHKDISLKPEFLAEGYNYDNVDPEDIPEAYLKKVAERKTANNINNIKSQLDTKTAQTFLKSGINRTQQAHEAVLKKRRK